MGNDKNRNGLQQGQTWKHRALIIALFNNMQNLKLKSLSTVVFFTAVNQHSRSPKKRINGIQKGQKVIFFSMFGGF